MALKEILVHVDDARGHDARLALACEFARVHQAHLAGLFVIDPLGFSSLASPGGAGIAEIQVMQELQEQHRSARKAIAAKLEGNFRTAADLAGVSGEWRIDEDDPAALLIAHGRYADLVIVGQSDPEFPPAGEAIPQTVLLSAGRPVLVVPYIGGDAQAVGRRVLVAWNASREATRAVHDAMPLLAQAEMVTVLSVNPAGGIFGEGDAPAADLAHHLARHGVKAEAAQAVAEDIGIGDLLLSRAADLGSDLIVMGGYGHSRLREFALGGATRDILRSMTVPVLFSH